MNPEGLLSQEQNHFILQMQAKQLVEEVPEEPLPSDNFLSQIDLPIQDHNAVIEGIHSSIVFDGMFPMHLLEQQYGGSGYSTCEICSQYKNGNQFFSFCCNQHKYCKGCIISMINFGINNFSVIKCPGEECLVEFGQNSPYYEFLKEADRNKLLKIRRNRKMLENPEVKLCRKDNCDGVLKIQEKKVECELCKEDHCSKCLQIAHKGRCDGKMARLLQRKHGFRRCPNCKMVVQKNLGCDHITCYCSYQFCYICGKAMKPSHICELPKSTKFFGKIRDQLLNPSSSINNIINCGKILQLLEPDIQRSKPIKYLHIIVLTLLLYPVLNALLISAILVVLTVYMTVASILFVFYFIVKPIVQIKRLELCPSSYLLDKNVPKWLVRVIMIPMYPVNLLIVIFTIGRIFDCRQFCEACQRTFEMLVFFILLPCLMFVGDEEQD